MRRKPRTAAATCSSSALADGLVLPPPPSPPPPPAIQQRQMLPAARPSQQRQACDASSPGTTDAYEPTSAVVDQQQHQHHQQARSGIQLTPVWEYVARQRQLPRDLEPRRLLAEISTRLRDPEWQVRQHALRVLVDVLPYLEDRDLDSLVQELLLSDLVANLGNSAPAVRKGSLDALRIYLLHSRERDLATRRILRMGVEDRPAAGREADQVLRGVLLSAPLLLFPSRSTGRPSSAVVREATRTLAMHLVQVQHQEAALRSLVKIRDSCVKEEQEDGDRHADGLSEVDAYLRQIDESIVRNFELLCDVYGLGKRKKIQPNAKKKNKQQLVKAGDKVRTSADENRRKTAARRRQSSSSSSSYQSAPRKYNGETAGDVVVPLQHHLDKWESDEDHGDSDSDTSGIAEVDDESSGVRSGSGSSVTSARVVLETEIKFNEETAITMTILEEQDKEVEGAEISELTSEQQQRDDASTDGNSHLAIVDEKKKLPRRVHFGGEIVKLRTPDSEDASSVASSMELSSSIQSRSSSRSPPPTRIPLPVAPATRLPVAQPRRSMSQPIRSSSRGSSKNGNYRGSFARRRSASSSPKRDVYKHDASLSPKKGILAKSSDFGDSRSSATGSRTRSSRRDSYVAATAAVAAEAPAFQIYEEPDDDDDDDDDEEEDENYDRTPSPRFLGEACGIDEEDTNARQPIESVFGDRSDYESYDKIWKNQENRLTKSRQRSNSALETPTRFDYWQDADSDGRRRSHSAIPGYEVFPRQERNYILMELSSPSKTRRASFAGPIAETRSDKSEDQQQQIDNKDDEDEEKIALDAKEKSSSSDGSDVEWKSPIEESWEELGLVDDEILRDFHNKDDWRARVRGLERIASALRQAQALSSVEPRLGSLLHAVLAGERSCRVAAAGLAVARVLLQGCSEQALRERLALIAWGLARHGGPQAAQLARLTMLRTSPGLFLEALLQPHCIDARNAKMRENALQLLIFSLVTFPSTEFKVKTAIERVVAMVDDRRKRVRHSALDTLAVLSQMYDSENILEVSKRFTADKPEGPEIHAAIKTRLSRKLLPTVSADGLVVYGLQISSNIHHSGPDVDWITAGSGSVSPGTGRTRGQLIAKSKIENDQQQQQLQQQQQNEDANNDATKKRKIRPVSEHSVTSGTINLLLDKNERTASWQFLPQLDDNNRQSHHPESRLRKNDRVTKSADSLKVSKLELQDRVDLYEQQDQLQRPYATPTRSDRQHQQQQTTSENNSKIQRFKRSDDDLAAADRGSLLGSSSSSGGVGGGGGNITTTGRGGTALSSSVQIGNSNRPTQESRIPVYTRERATAKFPAVIETSNSSSSNNNVQSTTTTPNAKMSQQRFKDSSKLEHSDSNGYFSMQQRRTIQSVRSAAMPRTNFTVNHNRDFGYTQFVKSIRAMDAEIQAKFKDDLEETRDIDEVDFGSSGRRHSVVKHSRLGSRSVPVTHYHEQQQQHYSVVKDTFESIYQRQNRYKVEKSMRIHETSPSPSLYGYESFSALQKYQIKQDENSKDVRSDLRQKRNTYSSSVDEQSSSVDESSTTDKEGLDGKSKEPSQADSGRTISISRSTNHSNSSPQRDDEDTRSNNSSNSSGGGGGSVTNSARRVLKNRRSPSLAAHTESDESSSNATTTTTNSNNNNNDRHRLDNNNHSDESAATIVEQPLAANASGLNHRNESPVKAFDVISTPQEVRDNKTPGRKEHIINIEKTNDDEREKKTCPEAMVAAVPPSTVSDSSVGSTVPSVVDSDSNSSEMTAKPSSVPAVECVFGSVEEEEEEEVFHQATDAKNAPPSTDSNVSVYSCESTSPKLSSPKSQTEEDQPEPVVQYPDSDEAASTPPPVPIGFDGPLAERSASSSEEEDEEDDDDDDDDDEDSEEDDDEDDFEDEGVDEVDNVSYVPQSRQATPIDVPRRLAKVSPCKMRPDATCHRSRSVNGRPAHNEKQHHDKPTKALQQCFNQLENKDWEVTLKGLRALGQIARDEPEQLDACPPGMLARLLGKQIKNLRSQVARVACSTASQVFGAHVRGIEQDLDEIAAPLLHRTADTNRFLREDCNSALDAMVDHFPPQKTILTVANRGASHQNTIVHATTARLICLIVSEIGAENAMLLPREVRDKLFATNAKLLTDGNLQARKHAKETFRLLFHCEGFQKALTDAVPESTLRLIDKTLKSL